MGQVTDNSAKVGVTSQNISITDMITEGPVRGLKNGKSSVFLNDIAAEDASYSGVAPIQSAATGTITFNGTSATSTATTGVSLDTNMILSTGDGSARDIVITNYKTQAVNLSNVGQDAASQTSITVTAASGTPFTDIVWSSTVLTRKAALVADGHVINGTFYYTSSTVGVFYAGFTATDTIDTTKDWTLHVLHSFLIQSIDSSTQLTVQSNNIPAAGTYNFRVGEFRPISPRDLLSQNIFAANNLQKIDGLQIEATFGTLDQTPLTTIGGVGGAAAGTEGKNDEIKVIGTGVISGIEPIKEVRNKVQTSSVAGLPDDSTDDVASAALEYADTAFGITASQRSEVDEIGFRITYPGGLQNMNNEKGKRETAYAWYVVQIATKINGSFGDWQNAFPDEGQYVKHRGKTNAAYSFDHVIHLDQYRPFDEFKIRIVRVTRHIGLSVTGNGHSNDRPDKDKWTLIAKSKVDQLNYVIKDKFRYPYTAMVQTSFNSKLYQQPPKMSYEMQGMLVRIPSNYTPREYSTATDTSGNPKAVYTGLWNGTWKNNGQGFYTDNPAWIFMDIVTNNRYGAGKWIKEEDIDKYALYRIAKYCDELVDDGNGGVEPRFRANIFLTKATDVYKVLKDFASTFTGMLYWLDGNIVPVEDASTDPVYTFTKGNVIDGAFSYESTGRKTRPNQIVVTWNDPDQNYEAVNLIVEDRQAILKDKKLIKENATAFGCTSESQAIRYGRWKLWTAQKQTEIVSFKSALNSLYIRPGDVINVQDADRYGVQYSGRVSSATSSTVTLDRNVTLNAGSTYVLSTLVTSGDTTSIEENTITNSSGSTNVLSVSSFTDTPSANTIWALKETKDGLNVAGSKKQYKVLSITQEGANTFGFSCVEHYDEKYGAIESGFATSVIPDTIYPEIEPQVIPAPSNLRAILETDATRPGEEIRLEWDAPDSDFIVGYQIIHTLEEYENPLITSNEHYRLENIPNGVYAFRVRAVSNRGNYSPYIGLDFEVDDPYADNVDRVQYGIPKGAISNSEAGITGDAGSESFTFAKSSLALASNGDKETVVNPDENSQSVADITAEENYYIFLDADTPTLKLMYYDTESLENMPFWRDVGTGDSASSTSWTSIGSVSVSANTNRVTGSGFNTSVELRDILNLSGSTTPTTPLGEGAVVIGIVSDTELIIDRTFDTAISSTTAYRANYRPDYAGDAAIARVHKDSSDVFSTERFLTVDPNFGATPRSLLVNVDPSFLTYDIQGDQTNTPSSIDAEVYAIGFTDPEFKMELPNRTNPVADNELDGTEVDFTSGETDNLFKKDFTVDTAGTVEYAASDLSAVFTVREKNNTDLTATRTVTIPRRRDAASVFLELDNDNVTVFADTTNGAATVTFNCTATVSRGNNLFDIIAPDNVFVITVSATTGITGSLSGATYSVTSLAQNFTSGSVTFTATGVAGSEFDGVVLTKVMSISISSTSGVSAEVYQINSSVGSISYNPNTTTFVPATSTGVTFSSQKIVGSDAPITFSNGYWRIFKNGSSTASYSSSSAESSVNFTNYSATDTLITAKLYLESAASTLLDSETVSIVLSGEDGDTIPGDDQGAVRAYGGGGTVTWDNSERAWALAASGDTTTGAAWPAFRVNSTSDQKWVIELEVKASSSGATSGFYARIQELDGNLSAGKTHVSNAASSSDSVVQEDTRQRVVGHENTALGDDWTKISFTYTPTSTATFVSLLVLNWEGLGTRTVYVRNIKRVVKGADGVDGDISKTVKLYQKGSTAPTDPANGTGFNTTTGLAAAVGSWAVNPPTPTTTENVYVSEAVVTQSNGTGDYSMTQDWVTSLHAAKLPTDGDNGLQTIQGYLYYESTSGQPTAPSGNTYNISGTNAGLVTGTGINIGTSTTNTWENSPRTQDPTSSNTHYTVRYYGTQLNDTDTDINVNYSNVVQYTNFSGVVTFTGGTFSQGTTDITTIDGGNITTGTISAESLTVTARDLVNPVSTTQHLAGWGGVSENQQDGSVTSTDYLEYDSTENAIEVSNYIGSGSTYYPYVYFSSDSFIVNPNKIYKISYKIKFNNTTGIWYAGLRYNTTSYTGQLVPSTGGSSGGYFGTAVFDRWDGARSQGSRANNFYFVNSESKADFTSGYSEYVHYILGANRNITDVPDFVDQGALNDDSLDTDFPFVKVVPVNADDIPHVALRFLSWNNSSSSPEKLMYIKDVSVTEIDSGKIVADNIVAGAITSEQLEISNTTTGSEGIFMGLDGSGNPKIEIRDASALRVKIGYLGT